ncbi:ATP-binding protein [Streptomyces sp. NPDC056708]|uniref:ATP-binding protein n=1 Tax=unclassified Streptomyces TaxID=2593676 RepID=UPI0036B2F22F
MTNTLHKYFDAKPPSVGLARQFVITTLTSWGIVGDPAEDIRLCASELVSNALAHGTRRGHGFLVRLSADEDFVRLEIHDSRNATAERHPRVRYVSDTDTAGRGLCIVEALADGWGIDDRDPYGKVVWSRFKAVPEIQPV